MQISNSTVALPSSSSCSSCSDNDVAKLAQQRREEDLQSGKSDNEQFQQRLDYDQQTIDRLDREREINEPLNVEGISRNSFEPNLLENQQAGAESESALNKSTTQDFIDSRNQDLIDGRDQNFIASRNEQDQAPQQAASQLFEPQQSTSQISEPQALSETPSENRQQNLNSSYDAPSQQNLTAISAYQSVDAIAQRDNIQQVFGVDLRA